MDIKVLQPSFYKDFSCSGSECRNTCCQNWNIVFSKKEVKTMKSSLKTDEVKEIFKDSLEPVEGTFASSEFQKIKLNNDRMCPLLSEDGLCKIQLDAGYTAMPATCRVYPRQIFMLSGLFELTLTCSCERVCELLMREKDGIEFEQSPYESLGRPGVVDLGGSSFPKAYKYYFNINYLTICVLQNRDYTLENRLLLLGVAYKNIDDLEKQDRLHEIPQYVDEFIEGIERNNDLTKLFENTRKNNSLKTHSLLLLIEKNKTTSKELFKNLLVIAHRIDYKLSVQRNLQPSGDVIIENQINFNSEKYEQAVAEFEEFIKGKEYFMENVAITYYLYLKSLFSNKKLTIWEHYIAFVLIFNIYKFILACVLTKDSTEQQLIDVTAACSRTLIHNKNFMESIVEHLEKNDCSTLAKVAISIL